MNDFGPGFADAVSQVKNGESLDFGEDGKVSGQRGNWFRGIGWWLVLGLGMLVLLGRLVQLQAIDGGKNRMLADEQRIRLVQVPAPRGLIMDRNNEPLVQNRPIFRRLLVNEKSGVQLEPISRDKALEMEVEGFEPSIVEGVGRRYLFGPTLAHLLGYVGEVSAEELADKSLGYELGDLVGRAGVEVAYDKWLKGENGARLVEVDTAGRLVRQVGDRKAVPGRRLDLTIDLNLQKVAETALQGKKGAIVVTKPETSEVLALVSWPSYDPEILDPMNAEVYKDEIMALFNNEEWPLVNRAVSAVYAPGSTFKIVTAAAALEEALIDENYVYEDTGIVRSGDYEYKNWYLTQYGGKEGLIGINRAIARSTDTFFYKTGEMVGAQKLADWGRKFGLGSLTGIGLGEEVAGLVPDPEWKLKTIGEPWYLGNTYHMAIGQADLLATPLQVNMMTGVIVNGGKWCKPYLVQNPESRIQNPELINNGCKQIGLSEKTMAIIKEGMIGACSPGGGGFPLFSF